MRPPPAPLDPSGAQSATGGHGLQPPPANAHEFSVSELAQAVRRAVEDEFGYVRVRGEISGFRGQHSSGHAYFTLKDDRRLDRRGGLEDRAGRG